MALGQQILGQSRPGPQLDTRRHCYRGPSTSATLSGWDWRAAGLTALSPTRRHYFSQDGAEYSMNAPRQSVSAGRADPNAAACRVKTNGCQRQHSVWSQATHWPHLAGQKSGEEQKSVDAAFYRFSRFAAPFEIWRMLTHSPLMANMVIIVLF